ncbi:MAG: helix-turn-helix domain-containing protein [Candidatus Muirbacterium halophilum]|nr:helix-turn-helix domain-containing protein [Candidatus Muirbacterium halophilum]
MKEQPSYYSILTASVRYSKSISDFEKILFSDITCLTNKNGICTATNNYFAEAFSKSKSTISRSIANLEKAGFIQITLIFKNESREVEKRNIRISENRKNDDRGISKNDDRGISKNEQDNNTSNNNTSNNIKNNKKENPIFSEFLKELKESATFKAKITKTKEGSEFFDKIENKEKLKIDYLNHQLEFGNFAKKITPFLEDYNTVSQLLTKPNSLQIQKTKEPTQIFIDFYRKTGRSDFAFLQASLGLSYQQQAQLEKFQRDFELEIVAQKFLTRGRK